MKVKFFAAFFFLFMIFSSTGSDACTNLIVTKGATKDGSVIITYTCDGEFLPHFGFEPAKDYLPTDSLTIGGIKIPRPAHTYQVMHLMNEFQVAIGETTFGGRNELVNHNGHLHYWTLMKIALRRSKTAREAIDVITSLVEKYGYASSGESFSIADKNEAWLLEMIGPGNDGSGAIWVAVKIPDGYISAHANKSRIGTFPMDNPENCIYSPNVIRFAIERGYYNPDSGEPFRFNEAYCPATPKNRRYADGRVWSLFRRAAPSINLSPDYFRGVEDAEEYPLWIKPDKKLSLEDIFSLMRDHFEGTDFDMTKGIDAGPYGSPYRWRPITWEVDSVEYSWERPISTQQTAYSIVAQSRNWLPDAIGGVLWYGVDDTYFTCYMPQYCKNTDVANTLRTGRMDKFSWDSAWWVFNFVSNFANLKYSYMIQDIQKVQSALEGELLVLQPAIEKTALDLYEKNPEQTINYLTDYSVSHSNKVVNKWRDLGEYLITKYNDGYVQEKPGRPSAKGYPVEWLRKVIEDEPNKFVIPENKKKKPESKLVD